MQVLKPYNIADVGENDAEINMYGEVVENRPTNFWTDEPVDGNYIVLSEFIADLDNLKSKKNITIHINSVGGGFYSGAAIYNRLKELSKSGVNITTINDGLAASAGSIIFMAGTTRRMNAGSNLMIHQASGFLYGYYSIRDLDTFVKTLKAANKAEAQIYAEVTGLPEDTIKAQIDRETWFTGDEAVSSGYATELADSGEPVKIELSADRKEIGVNGIPIMHTAGLSNIPASIPVAKKPFASIAARASAGLHEDKTKKTEGREENKMEIKTIDDLRKACPDLLAQAEKAAADAAMATATANAVAAERERLRGIDEIQNMIADKNLLEQAKYGEKPMTAEQLAFAAMKAQASAGAKALVALENDSKVSGVEGVKAAPNAGTGEDPDVKAEEDIAASIKAYKKMMGKE